MIELSILIATIKARASLLSRLLARLEPQVAGDPYVEVIVHWSERKHMATKFNELYRAAYGRLAVQVDDDDLVAEDYVTQVLAHSVGHDFVGYQVDYTVNGTGLTVYEIDPRRAENVHRPYDPQQRIRHVTPKCPVLTSRARMIPFGQGKDTDWHWSWALISNGYPVNPVFIPRRLYHYDCWPEHSLGTKPSEWTPQREVPMEAYDPANFTWIT